MLLDLLPTGSSQTHLQAQHDTFAVYDRLEVRHDSIISSLLRKEISELTHKAMNGNVKFQAVEQFCVYGCELCRRFFVCGHNMYNVCIYMYVYIVHANIFTKGQKRCCVPVCLSLVITRCYGCIFGEHAGE